MRKVIPFLVTAAVIAAMVWQSITPEAELMPAPSIEFPEIAGSVCEDMEMSETERSTLPADTVIKRRMYRFSDGRSFLLSAVVGGRSKSSVHRPELCLPGQGYGMIEPRTISVDGTSWRELVLERRGEPRSLFAYTFNNGTGFRTSSHLVRIFTDVWDRSVLGRIDRWVMITVVAPGGDEITMSGFLSRLEGVVK